MTLELKLTKNFMLLLLCDSSYYAFAGLPPFFYTEVSEKNEV